MALIIPETIFLYTLVKALKLIRDDWNNNTDKTKTYLYKLFFDSKPVNNNTTANLNKLEKYELYLQAQKVFLLDANDDNPRPLDVHLFFNKEKANLPSIHITLGKEVDSANNSMGLGSDGENVEYDDGSGTLREQFERRYDTQYQFVVTSSNPNEVITIYHGLRAMLIALTPHFNALGLEQIRLYGNDLNIQDLIPNIYARAIPIAFSYTITVGELFDRAQTADLIFNFPVPPTDPEDESDTG